MKPLIMKFFIFFILFFHSFPVFSGPMEAVVRTFDRTISDWRLRYSDLRENFVPGNNDFSRLRRKYPELRGRSELVKSLQNSDGNPDTIITDSDLSDKEIFDVIQILWREGDHDIFFRHWDSEKLRPIMVDFLTKDHLSGDMGLFMKWWDEIGSTEAGPGKLEELMTSSFEGARIPRTDYFSFSKIMKISDNNPFLQMVFEACDNNRNVAESVRKILDKVINEGDVIAWWRE